MTNTLSAEPIAHNAKRLLWAGFLAILAAGIGFGVRGGILANWAADFGFTGAQLGAIGGAGFTGGKGGGPAGPAPCSACAGSGTTTSGTSASGPGEVIVLPQCGHGPVIGGISFGTRILPLQ